MAPFVERRSVAAVPNRCRAVRNDTDGRGETHGDLTIPPNGYTLLTDTLFTRSVQSGKWPVTTGHRVRLNCHK
jgi:hypothetical protein